MFAEVHNALQRIWGKLCAAGQKDDNIIASNIGGHLEELEDMLLKEREEFQVFHVGFCIF